MASIPEHLELNNRISHQSRGYFAFPLIEEDLEDPDFEQWCVVAEFVDEAKRGNFHKLPALLPIYDASDHWMIRHVIATLIGDAGTDALIVQLYHYLLSDLPVDYSWDFSMILTMWGRLDIVPMLTEAWRLTYEFDDARTVSRGMALMLEEEMDGPLFSYLGRGDSEAEADALVKGLLARHAELTKQLGEHAFVFRGRLLDVEWIARRALTDLAELTATNDYRFQYMRWKFEAMTGIDCSCFYKGGHLQPLAAAAVLEAFLASPECKRFVPGQRYFFGHPIPYGDPAGAADWPPRGE